MSFKDHLYSISTSGESFIIIDSKHIIWRIPYDDMDGNKPEKLDFDGIFTSVSSSENYSLFIKDDGSVWCIGSNSYGQFGNPKSNEIYKKPIKINDIPLISQVKACNKFSILLDYNGYIWISGECSIIPIEGFNKLEKFKKIENIPVMRDICVTNAKHLFMDMDGKYWEFNQNNESQNILKHVEYLEAFTSVSSSRSSFLYVDKKGHVFASGNSRGLPDKVNSTRNSGVSQNIHEIFPYLPSIDKVIAGMNTSILLEKNIDGGYHVWEIGYDDYDIPVDELEEFESPREYFLTYLSGGRGKNSPIVEGTKFRKLVDLPSIIDVHLCDLYTLYIDYEGYIWSSNHICNYTDFDKEIPKEGFIFRDYHYEKLPMGEKDKYQVNVLNSKQKSARKIVNVGEKRTRSPENDKTDEPPLKKTQLDNTSNE